MQSYEYEYNGFTINFIDTASTMESTSSEDCSTQSPRSRKIIAVQKVSGFTAPEIRHSQSDIAGNHGFVDHLSYVGGRIISLEGILQGNNEVETMEMIEDLCFYWNVADVPTPDSDGYARLTFTKEGEISKFVLAKIHSLPSIDRNLQSRNHYTFQVQFRCQDPRIYSTILHSEEMEKAVLKSGFPTLFPKLFGVSGYYNEVNLPNIGNFAAPVSYTITNNGISDVNVPRMTNVTRGIYQEFDMTLEPGDSITVDTIEGTAVDQDGNNILVNETADSGWLYASARKSDAFRLTSDLGNPTATIEWRDTWISAPR